ncbi:Enoyl-CoA hydratase/isomerase [Candidatus Koribacter versatilis Ellin345]|uniref:Enoyl-CoA hydratase/isomerase n=1 Tax=Koribacter versatilis (strain Ellin345) TaxID=204669 RepID=Q1IRS2_KORVE|nr:enoyl-CoA hydratase-related protein [Candidatus Koribacter versatilis]ABF40428.1 Enoyl-CoA hydratase/isomerase [Candidatus Koribacter versatilis Ellin345]
MGYKTLLCHTEGAVATITINRPEKRNAMSYELIDELLTAMAEVENSPAQLLVLTGAGNAFCSGMDLENLRQITGNSTEQNLKDTETVARLFRTLYDFPKITIAAVNGAAIAGGTGLATLCDFTIASSEAKFGYTEVRIGFTPAIVSSFLVRQIGEKQARDLLLTGRILSADEAFRIGLITEVVPPEKLNERVQQLCETLLQNSPASLVATKRLINSFSADELDRHIPSSMRANAEIRTTADFREGVTAFLEKRKPQWSGR